MAIGWDEKMDDDSKTYYLQEHEEVPSLKEYYSKWLNDDEVQVMSYPILYLITPLAYYYEINKNKKLKRDNLELLI